MGAPAFAFCGQGHVSGATSSVCAPVQGFAGQMGATRPPPFLTVAFAG